MFSLVKVIEAFVIILLALIIVLRFSLINIK